MTDHEQTQSSCPKCGGGEVRWAWHKTNWPHRKGCLYGDNSQPSGEHLHAYCQRCHYDWFEDVIPNVA